MSQAEIIYKIIGLAILVTMFIVFIYMIWKIQSLTVKNAKAEMDLNDALIKSKVSSEPLTDLVDDNNARKSGHNTPEG